MSLENENIILKQKLSQLEIELQQVRDTISIPLSKLKQETIYRQLIEYSSDIIYEINTEGLLTYISPSWTKLLGHQPQEVLGHQFEIFIHPNDLAERKAFLLKLIRNKTDDEIEYRVLHKNGNYIWYKSRVTIVKSGNEKFYIGNARDTSAEKYAQEKVHLVEFTIQKATMSVFWIKSNATFFEMSEAAHNTLGYTKDELMRLSIEDINPEYSIETWPNHWEELKKNKTLEFITKQKKKDGTELLVEIKANFIQFGDIELNCAFVTDISERSKIEQELKESEQRFNVAIAGSSDGIWDWDVKTNSVYFSGRFKTMLGYTENDYLDGPKFLIEAAHPDDYNRTVLAIEKSLSNKTNYSNEYRLKLKTGTYKWFLVRGQAIWDENNAPIRMAGSLTDIHEKKLAQEELQKANERLIQSEEMLQESDSLQKAIISALPDLIFRSSADGTFIDYHAPDNDLLIVPPEEFIGKKPTDFMAPDLGNELIKIINHVVTSQELVNYEYSLNLNDKEYDFEGRIVPFGTSEVLAIIRNVTDKKIAEKGIKESEERFKSLVHNISDIISLIDEKGFIKYQSSSIKQIMGYEENELQGKNIFEIVHPEDHLIVAQAFKNAIENEGNSPVAEFRLLNKNGDYIYLEAQGNNQLNNPSIKAIVVNSRDISQKKKAEFEKLQLIKELTQNNKELKQFSYITSHNMRAPVTNLMAIADLIDLSKIEDNDNKELIKGFKTSTFHLNETLNDLIKILIIKENTNQNLQYIKLDTCLEEVKYSIDSIIKNAHTQIEVDFSASNEIYFNNAYMESIFLNLITNSIKYKHQDRNPIISIYTQLVNGQTVLYFRDNGIGFNEEKVKGKIFGLYQKFHNHPDSKGIGLYLVQSQISSLGGTIDVESKEGVGTKFIITFAKK
ncbi:MAG: PAS domain S-box protein [Bacteroidota bacterium]